MLPRIMGVNMMSATNAVDLATRVDEVGFPEFTAKLIGDVFDALVAAMIRQQEAYADLLEKVAKTIEEFEAQEVQDEEVDAWLLEQFPLIQNGKPVTGKTAIAAGNKLTEEQVAKLKYLLGKTAEDMNKKKELDGIKKDDTLTADQVNMIKSLVRRKIAKKRMDALKELVSMGIVRVVVESGRIRTRLDFTTYGGQWQNETYTQYRRKTWGIGGRGGIWGSIFGLSLGGGIRSLSVSTYTKKNTAYTSAKIEIGGEVEINIRGDYVPLKPPEE